MLLKITRVTHWPGRCTWPYGTPGKPEEPWHAIECKQTPTYLEPPPGVTQPHQGTTSSTLRTKTARGSLSPAWSLPVCVGAARGGTIILLASSCVVR